MNVAKMQLQLTTLFEGTNVIACFSEDCLSYGEALGLVSSSYPKGVKELISYISLPILSTRGVRVQKKVQSHLSS